MRKTILVISGVSGVGKNSIISKIIEQSCEFEFIAQFTTRKLREGEWVRKSVTDDEMDAFETINSYVIIHASNGRRYAVELNQVNSCIEKGKVPVIDWPLSRFYLLRKYFGHLFFFVYVMPPSIEELSRRLKIDERDGDGSRLQSGIEEVDSVKSIIYDKDIDLRIISEKDKEEQCAKIIVDNFFRHGR